MALIWVGISWANVLITDKEPIPVQTEDPNKVEIDDKISDTSYAGIVTAATEDSITILVNGTEEYTYVLTERALRDLKTLEIAVDDEAIVNFETLEDGTLSAISLEKVVSSLR